MTKMTANKLINKRIAIVGIMATDTESMACIDQKKSSKIHRDLIDLTLLSAPPQFPAPAGERPNY